MLCRGHPYYGRFSHRTDIIPTTWLRRLFYPEKGLRLFGRLDVVASENIESTWRINGFVDNQGPVTAQQMFIRVVSNRNCKFHAMGEWLLVRQDSRASTFERAEDGYDYATGREWYAEFSTIESLHPGVATWIFQCVEVRGLVASGMQLEIEVFSHDQAPVTGNLIVDGKDIHEFVTTERKKHRSEITVRLAPQELLATY